MKKKNGAKPILFTVDKQVNVQFAFVRRFYIFLFFFWCGQFVIHGLVSLFASFTILT